MNNYFKNLLDFYEELDLHLKDTYNEKVSCGECNRCCRYPYFYVSLYEPEYALIQEYIKEMKIPFRIHFEPFISTFLDKRVYHKDWLCPLYSKSAGGCSIYPVRPFPCRVFGVYQGVRGRIDECSYNSKAIVFKSLNELPFWEKYVDVLESYGSVKKGYLFPDSSLYEKPSLEFLLGYEFPWSYSTNYAKNWRLKVYFPTPIDITNYGTVMKFGNNDRIKTIYSLSPPPILS